MHMSGENYVQTNLSSKQCYSERKHVRKHALGEIKNIIHNQGLITPFKGLCVGTSKALSANFLKSQAELFKTQVETNQKIEQIAQNISGGLGEKDATTCNEKCNKSLEEIWSERNVFKSEVIENLISGYSIKQEDHYDKTDHNVPLMESDDITVQLQDPLELETEKLLRNLLAMDFECSKLPLVIEWIDDL